MLQSDGTTYGIKMITCVQGGLDLVQVGGVGKEHREDICKINKSLFSWELIIAPEAVNTII